MEEAIARANDTRYGLAAGVVTKDIDVANRMTRSIRAPGWCGSTATSPWTPTARSGAAR